MFRIDINKDQTNYIKGIAILLIVMHNYFHWVAPNTGENEFVFSAQAINNLSSSISDSYLNIINSLFSFFGHYGVQVFIFISGYGLAKSRIAKPQSILFFLKRRIAKIYPVFLMSIVVLIMYNALVYSSLPNVGWLKAIVAKLLMLHTLIPGQALSINGPWWFYGLIVQLYIVFNAIFYVVRKWEWKGVLMILTVSYLSIYCLYTPLLDRNIYIMANAPGHIPEFTLGVLFAIYPKNIIRIWYVPFVIGLFVLGNFNFVFFPFTFICITYLLVIFIMFSYRERSIITKIVMLYGEISMFLFAIHGFFRSPYFVRYANRIDDPVIIILIGVFYLVTVTVIAFVCQRIYNYLQKNVARTK